MLLKVAAGYYVLICFWIFKVLIEKRGMKEAVRFLLIIVFWPIVLPIMIVAMEHDV